MTAKITFFTLIVVKIVRVQRFKPFHKFVIRDTDRCAFVRQQVVLFITVKLSVFFVFYLSCFLFFRDCCTADSIGNGFFSTVLLLHIWIIPKAGDPVTRDITQKHSSRFSAKIKRAKTHGRACVQSRTRALEQFVKRNNTYKYTSKNVKKFFLSAKSRFSSHAARGGK